MVTMQLHPVSSGTTPVRKPRVSKRVSKAVAIPAIAVVLAGTAGCGTVIGGRAVEKS